jgi:hypothetical protein
MHRIDTTTKQADKFGTGKDGFTAGNPGIGTPPTDLNETWCDSVQEEIAGVIEGVGHTLSATVNKQLLRTILGLHLKHWERRVTGSSSGMYALCVGGSSGRTLVVVGVDAGTAHSIWSSTDGGYTWTSRVAGTATAASMQAVAWGGSIFVAGGSTHTLVTSADGATWADGTLDNSTGWVSGLNAVEQIIWTGTQFVLAGTGGEVQTSPDGTTWTHRAKILSAFYPYVRTLCYANGLYLDSAHARQQLCRPHQPDHLLRGAGALRVRRGDGRGADFSGRHHLDALPHRHLGDHARPGVSRRATHRVAEQLRAAGDVDGRRG